MSAHDRGGSKHNRTSGQSSVFGKDGNFFANCGTQFSEIATAIKGDGDEDGDIWLEYSPAQLEIAELIGTGPSISDLKNQALMVRD